MTRLYDLTIPDKFVRQDDRTTAADQFLNVHDLQTAYGNINTLIAKRLRTPVLTLGAVDDDGAGGDIVVQAWNDTPLVAQSGEVVVDTPIWVPPMCDTMEVRIRAHASSAGGDVYLYPVVNASGQTRPPSNDYVIQVTGLSEAEYSVSFPVPGLAARQMGGSFRLYATSELAASSVQDSEAVLAAGIGNAFSGGSWVEVLNQLTSGNVIGFDDTEIQPRIIREEVAVSGGYRYYVQGQWNKVPDSGDTAQTYSTSNLHLISLCLIPKRVTSFGSISVAGE